ncbi:MAG: flagellar biosynthetic protein FliR [SAR324 cluster bacterium]|nr:flagellar biosynthetic protein FliR [SAR324 cluster bacterium]
MNSLFFQLADIQGYLGFFLLLLRMGGFFQTMPIFGQGAIPFIVKLFISIVLSIFFYKFYELPNFDFSLLNILDFGILGIKEVLLGVLLGILLRVVFYAVLYAADLISNMIGFSYASFFNPQDNQPSVIIGIFLELVAVLLFLSFGLHHFLVSFIYNSYLLVPPLSFGLSNFSYMAATSFISQIFLLGLSFAGPMVAGAIILNLSLGFANRSVPQMNVFLVGTALLIFLSLAFLAISMPFFAEAFRSGWFKTVDMINDILPLLKE